MNYRNDTILQKLFYFHRTDPLIWLPRIRKMNTWANQLDIIIAAYMLHINIITVGNYMHGFICNNMQLYMNNVLRSSDYCITEGGTLYVYFHEFQHPMRRMTDGNHFAYMEPILHIADTNLANQQDEQMCTVTNVRNSTQCNTNHGITNLDAINKEYGQLQNAISLDDSSELTQTVESCPNEYNNNNRQDGDEDLDLLPLPNIESYNKTDKKKQLKIV